MRRLLALSAAALLASACRSPENPAQRYERFALAAREGKAGSVWSMLSSGSQERMRARAKELGLPGDPARLVVGDLAPSAPRVKSATVLRESPKEAIVAVETEDGARGEVRLVREGEEWKVVLPGGKASVPSP